MPENTHISASLRIDHRHIKSLRVTIYKKYRQKIINLQAKPTDLIISF